MLVMPSNATGWFWHSLARETGRLAHLYSPGGERGPWPWFPYAFDNGAFACWEPKTNTFDDLRWAKNEVAWKKLLQWSHQQTMKPMWAIVPDVPGNAERTLRRWYDYKDLLGNIPKAVAVQDGMMPSDVKPLQPDVIAVGGSTDWKWSTVEMWAAHFPRVHVLRVNSPTRLYQLEDLNVESCDGTGWGRGDLKQTSGLEEWARRAPLKPYTGDLWPFVCKGERRKRKKEVPAPTEERAIPAVFKKLLRLA